jgi:hypothetical protein
MPRATEMATTRCSLASSDTCWYLQTHHSSSSSSGEYSSLTSAQPTAPYVVADPYNA